jgi:hypothetical protein
LLGSPGAIKAEFSQECTQLFQAVHGGSRRPEFHPCAGRVEHPCGDDRGRALRGPTDEYDLGASYLAVQHLHVGATRRVPWIVDARRKSDMGRMKLACSSTASATPWT